MYRLQCWVSITKETFQRSVLSSMGLMMLSVIQVRTALTKGTLRTCKKTIMNTWNVSNRTPSASLEGVPIRGSTRITSTSLTKGWLRVNPYSTSWSRSVIITRSCLYSIWPEVGIVASETLSLWIKSCQSVPWGIMGTLHSRVKSWCNSIELLIPSERVNGQGK